MKYYFNGDLCQLIKQKNLLLNYDLNIDTSDIQIMVETEEEYKNALSLIWNKNCDGWWHYEKQYIKYNICKKSQYMQRLCGELYLRHMINDELISNPYWENWWNLIKTGKIKINDIPVKYKEIKNSGIKLIYNNIEADNDNNIVVKIGDKITVDDKEFIID